MFGGSNSTVGGTYMKKIIIEFLHDICELLFVVVILVGVGVGAYLWSVNEYYGGSIIGGIVGGIVGVLVGSINFGFIFLIFQIEENTRNIEGNLRVMNQQLRTMKVDSSQIEDVNQSTKDPIPGPSLPYRKN